MNDFSFNRNNELFVITTITNWNEPPRIRHEVANLLSKHYNVLFIQIYSQRGKVRKRTIVNKSLVIEKSGLFFIGGTRILSAFPSFRKIYNKFLSKRIEIIVYKYGYNKAHLMNFQYDLPEIYDLPIFKKKLFFCNDDFVYQNPNSSKSEIEKKAHVQSEVIKKSDVIITVSYPLEKKLKIYGTPTEVVLSGHNFDIEKSKLISVKKTDTISVCYMGFLNQYIEIEWFKYILNYKNIKLTAIGPIAYKYLKDDLYRIPNFKHIEFLTDTILQEEMLKHDVLVMPYSSPIDNEVTSVPAKLFQYLAVGKPIVASNMKNLIKLPEGFVYKSSNQEEFLKLIKTAHHENSDTLKNKRIEFATNHTWEQRGIQLLNIIKQINK